MFETEMEICNDIIDKYNINAQEHGIEFTDRLVDNPYIKQHMQILEFFAHHRLFRDSSK